MKILYCFLYLAGTGILGFLLGRIVPKRWFCADRFPFRVRPWEQKLYQALRVKQWQNKLPDMSRTTAELSTEEKNAVSHRGKALAAMKEQIASYLK